MNPPLLEMHTMAAASNIILDVNNISWLSGQQACLQTIEGSRVRLPARQLQCGFKINTKH
jgi:hypothetical protein